MEIPGVEKTAEAGEDAGAGARPPAAAARAAHRQVAKVANLRPEAGAGAAERVCRSGGAEAAEELLILRRSFAVGSPHGDGRSRLLLVSVTTRGSEFYKDNKCLDYSACSTLVNFWALARRFWGIF